MNICSVTGLETPHRGNVFRAEVPLPDRIATLHIRVETTPGHNEHVSPEGFLSLLQTAYFGAVPAAAEAPRKRDKAEGSK